MARVLVLIVTLSAILFPRPVQAKNYKTATGDFETSSWVIEMPEYTLQLSQPLPRNLPDPGLVAARRENGERDFDLLERWALNAQRHHRAYERLYDDTLVWFAGRLLEVHRHSSYDGRLSQIVAVLDDGSIVRPSEINTYYTERGSYQRGSKIIRLLPVRGQVGFDDFEIATGMFGKQWHVFIGFDRTFDPAEVAEVRYREEEARIAVANR